MRVAALISGGKDSCYNVMQCVREGHDVVALVNLRPALSDEVDSYMFQTVGHQGIRLLAEALGLPLFQRTLAGASLLTSMQYRRTDGDEVEDLYLLLKDVKEAHGVDAISVGAILSDYQRLRVEDVCSRLNLTPLAYLWRRDQTELLGEMVACNLKAVLIKVACLGLKPEKHLGKELSELAPILQGLNQKYGVNVCGEGGEYETFTLDCPLFNKRLCIDSSELVVHTDSDVTPVAYLNLKMRLESKPDSEIQLPWSKRIEHLPMMDTTQRLRDIFLSDLFMVHRDSFESVVDADKSACDFDSGNSGGIANLANSELWPTNVECSSTGRTGLHLGSITAVRSVNVKADTEKALLTLADRLQSHGFSTEDVVYVLVFVENMSEFAEINSVYKHFFPVSPPARICVQVGLPQELIFQLLAYASHLPRATMHVQSVSHWAPSNIGPYSQVVTLAGTAADNRAAVTTCYVTSERDVPTAQRVHSQSKLGGLLIFCVVAGLPRGVDVEWHVTALACETTRSSGETKTEVFGNGPSTSCRAVIQHVDVNMPAYDTATWDNQPETAGAVTAPNAFFWTVSCHDHRADAATSEAEQLDLKVPGSSDVVECCCDAVEKACRGLRQCLVFFDCYRVDGPLLQLSLKKRCSMEVCTLVPCRAVYHSTPGLVAACCAAAGRDVSLTASHVAVVGCPA